MKKLGLILLTIFCASNLVAQDTTKIIKKVFSGVAATKLDTNQLVFDESGKQLKYYQYQKLLMSGEYTLRYSIKPTDSVQKKVLVKLNEQDKLMSMERFESSATARSPALLKNKVLDINPLLDYLTVNELGNKNILLFFWYAECPPCLENFIKVDEMMQKMSHPEDLIILSITRETKEKARTILKEYPFRSARLISDATSISKAYQLSGFPTFVVAAKNRVIQFSVTGFGPSTMPVIEKNLKALGL